MSDKQQQDQEYNQQDLADQYEQADNQDQQQYGDAHDLDQQQEYYDQADEQQDNQHEEQQDDLLIENEDEVDPYKNQHNQEQQDEQMQQMGPQDINQQNAGHFSESAQEDQVTVNELQQQQQLLQEEEELKKKIALYYHTLFQTTLNQWFVLMQQNNYSKMSKQQYIDLNIRIQKSLILDFDKASAKESAIEDWKIDIEREQFDRKINESQLERINENEAGEDDENSENNQNDGGEKGEDKEPTNIEYERLSEFFFDLCLSWCQHLDIETFLFFLNGIFLNITKGKHINVSVFKPLDEIEVLSIEFFNHLLAYRTNCDERVQNKETYSEWYINNFGKSSQIVQNVEKNLTDTFKDKNEDRILDMWMDLPTENPNSYINQHFEKLDKGLEIINRASKTTNMLTQSINYMEQIKKMSQLDKTQTKRFAYDQQRLEMTRYGQTSSNGMLTNFNANANTLQKKESLKIFNDREQRQEEIERRLIGQLGDMYKNAQLLELSENSYLIKNRIRLPILGQSIFLREKSKSRDSKRQYFLKQGKEYHLEEAKNIQKYVLDRSQPFPMPPGQHQMFSNQQHSNMQLQQQMQQPTNLNIQQPPMDKPILPNSNQVPTDNIQSHVRSNDQIMDQIARQAETLDSESDQNHLQNLRAMKNKQLKENAGASANNTQPIQAQQNQQLMSGQAAAQPQLTQYGIEQDSRNNINVKVPYTQQGPNPLQNRTGVAEDLKLHDSSMISNISPSNKVAGIRGQSPNQIDEKTFQQVYDRYLQMLQEDKNAKIETVLQEEPIRRQITGSLLEKDIEAAVYERLYAEEENQDIQEMIAKFYNKFDELHEQSLNAALAKSPSKIQIKNEVKFRIPERWTKKFHKHDIIPIGIMQENGISQERGKVNKQQNIDRKVQFQKEKESKILRQLSTQMPLNNSVLRDSQSEENQIQNQQSASVAKSTLPVDGKKDSLDQQIDQPGILNTEQNQPQTEQKQKLSPLNKQNDDFESTDVSKAGDFDPNAMLGTGSIGRQLYDWSEVAYLFENGEIPKELINITDPIEYNYLIVRLKKEFNEKHKSEYLKYMNLNLPYHSRRDEVGGVISNEDWTAFTERLDDIINRIKRKRKRIIKRRKKKGVKKMPRKTLFKPQKKIDLGKDPLWREIFVDQDEGDDSSGSEIENDEAFDMYKLAMANAQQQKGKNVTKLAHLGSQKPSNASSHQQSYKPTSSSQANREKSMSAKTQLRDNSKAGAIQKKEQKLVLPPIKMEKHGNQSIMSFPRKKSAKLQTAQQNYQAIKDTYPPAENLINIKMKDVYYNPFEKESHKPMRAIHNSSPMVKMMDHTYADQIRSTLSNKKQQNFKLESINNTNL